MTSQKDKALSGPLAQSIDIGFRAARVAIAVLALAWATMNVRQVPPDMQAVVTRFGAIERVKQAGLLAAWPRSFERVLLVPGPAQQMTLKVEANPNAATRADLTATDAPPSAGSYLTGDGAVALIDATLTYRVVDAAAYVVAEPHVAPALRRLAEGAAVAVAAGSLLDDFVVARPELADPRAQIAREALRSAYAAEVNRRLSALEAKGQGLGVEVTRADVSAFLPAAAKATFDQVLTAGQTAEQTIAQARTAAEEERQRAEQEKSRILADAYAAAAEKAAEADARTAEIASLAARAGSDARPALIERIYRERLGAILRSAGAVTALDARGGARAILPGSLQ